MVKGLYIHIPFCAKKCPYCDFYSVSFNSKSADSYKDAVIKRLNSYKGKNLKIDTVYFGGGTPNLMGGKRIGEILENVRSVFSLSDNAEITMEANPESLSRQDISAFCNLGINRLSLGLQSADENELNFIGRTHSTDDVKNCVKAANAAGIFNISLDLMLGLKGQTQESLKRSIEFCADLGAAHISSYMLKIEQNTPFYKKRALLSLPDEDEVCSLYLFAIEELKKHGYEQYEISNFAKNGAVSRHNLKYWNCEEYIGIGAAAHGFEDGQRYFYNRSINEFIQNPLNPTFDCKGGGAEEYFMLKLRLNSGLSLLEYKERFNLDFKPSFYKKLDLYENAGLLKKEQDTIFLTSRGFLVSNSIISELLGEIVF